jgi:hypothetical protein
LTVKGAAMDEKEFKKVQGQLKVGKKILAKGKVIEKTAETKVRTEREDSQKQKP